MGYRVMAQVGPTNQALSPDNNKKTTKAGIKSPWVSLELAWREVNLGYEMKL